MYLLNRTLSILLKIYIVTFWHRIILMPNEYACGNNNLSYADVTSLSHIEDYACRRQAYANVTIYSFVYITLYNDSISRVVSSNSDYIVTRLFYCFMDDKLAMNNKIDADFLNKK